MESGLIGRLRQPEYTGPNRCVPCTAVNVVIALVLGAIAALVQPLLAVAVIVASLLAIYFRGYLVPGTPTLTKRYFPDWLLAKFDKAPAPGAGGAIDAAGTTEQSSAGEVATADDAPTDDATPGEVDDDSDAVAEGEPATVDPESLFLDVGIVVPCEDRDDLRLADEIAERFRARVADARDGDREAQVADFLEVDPADVTVQGPDEREDDRDYVVVELEGRPAARWESEAALLADIAGLDVLEEAIGAEWYCFDLETRSQLASGLRAFVERCPSCDGPISLDEETVESCCRSYEVFAVTCEDCEARVLEVTG